MLVKIVDTYECDTEVYNNAMRFFVCYHPFEIRKADYGRYVEAEISTHRDYTLVKIEFNWQSCRVEISASTLRKALEWMEKLTKALGLKPITSDDGK